MTKKKVAIVPIGSRLIVGSDSGEKVTESGIILTQRADQQKIKSGKVLAVGQITIPVKIGDTVHYSATRFSEIDGYIVLNEHDILAKDDK